MIFTPVSVQDAFLIEPERREDQRGFFARTGCLEEFAAIGIESHIAQSSISFNRKRGTLRGMHCQNPPHQEVKIVRCTMGSIYDVIIDLRRDSPTFKHYYGVVLSADNRRMVYVPRGFAHGFQALEDNSEIFYQISEFYSPDHVKGVRWNDPAFGVPWPVAEPILIERDRDYPDFTDDDGFPASPVSG